VEWISLDINPVSWWANIISKTTDWSRVTGHVVLLPFSDEGNEEISLELSVQNLTEEVEV
jgi:hypothetical protein